MILSTVDDHLRLENRHTGEILILRRRRRPDGRVAITLDGSLPPGSDGPPPHTHVVELEEGIVKAGTLGAKVAGREIRVQTGESAAFPAGVRHNWWNAGDELLEFSGTAYPAADLDRFLEAVFAVVNASDTRRPNLFWLAHVLWRHRRTQVMAVPPPPVQKVLFPVILAIGHVLGKYKGDAWPGAPNSIKGAPEAAEEPSLSSRG